ncbi:acyltransferase family protein [Litorivivens sp.]|uniref:acyltransferase family protein n=1 Tax=Litorivivens sp. TaxID=2020868 RepID=UPI0035623C19
MKDRFDSLDGLRGLAALVVVIGHFWPFQNFKSLPAINIFMDTKLPVAIFFVLSGVVLTHAARNFKKDIKWLSFAILARYIRLLIPILAISLLVAALYASGFILVDKLPAKYAEWEGYKIFYQFPATLGNALQFSFFDVFFKYDPAKTFIPPSWTMRPELFASTLLYIFLIGLSLGRLDRLPARFLPLFIPLAVVVFFTKDIIPGVFYFAYFLMGYVAYRLYLSFGTFLKGGIFAIAFVLSAKSLLFFWGVKGLFIDLIFASLIVTLVISSWDIQAILANRVFLWLGKISFPLYLVHVPIFCSLGMFNFILLDSVHIHAGIGWGLNFAITLSVCLGAAHLLTFVDLGTLKLLRGLKAKYRLHRVVPA